MKTFCNGIIDRIVSAHGARQAGEIVSRSFLEFQSTTNHSESEFVMNMMVMLKAAQDKSSRSAAGLKTVRQAYNLYWNYLLENAERLL